MITDIYANLAARVKLHLDYLDSNGPHDHPDNRHNLHQFYMHMALDDQFNELLPSEFKVLDNKKMKRTNTSVSTAARPAKLKIMDPNGHFAAPTT